MRTATVGTVLVVVTALVGCSSGDDDAAAPGTSSPSSTTTSGTATTTPSDPTSSATPSPAPTPTQAPRYRPSSAEVDGPAKLAAARAVERLPQVERVTYTQYFGYLPPAASILVEADFTDGGGTTYDVRINRSGDRWRVESVEPAARVRTDPDRGSLAQQVLDSDRIDLPWAGRLDVASGRIADSVLRSMLEVARTHRLGISVLVAAHPVNVFGTDRRSNHPDGLAYDIGRIDGHLVVDPRYRRLVEQVMRTAAGTGAYQVGGPTDLDDGGGQYFSDPTHSDHVHVGFNG